MKRVHLSPYFSLFLSFALLIAPLPLSVMADSFNLQHDHPEATFYKENAYIFLDKNISNLVAVVDQMSLLDDGINSPISLLKHYCDEGATIALKEEVLDVLEYAAWLVDQQKDIEKTKQLHATLDEVFEQVNGGELDVDNVVARSHLPLWKINKRIAVLGKAIFESNVVFEKKTRTHGRARFYKPVHFKDNVKIDGELSVSDIVVQDLTIDGCVSDLCVDNLSVNNGVVNNSLTLNYPIANPNDAVNKSYVDSVASGITGPTGATGATGPTGPSLPVDSDNTPNTLVLRDSSGGFSAGTVSVIDEIIQNELRFNDLSGGDYVGVKSPSVVPTSYTVSLPSTVPTAHQVLRANATTPTNLEWAFEGGSVLPTASKTIYITKYGNDLTGDGSFNNPYCTLAKAIDIVNGLASPTNPMAIWLNSGVYVEDNSAGALAITVPGVSIVGESVASVIIMPNTPTNTLLSANNSFRMANVTLQSSAPLGIGLALFAGSLSTFNNVRFVKFGTAVSASGGSANSYGFSSCLFTDNGIAVDLNNARLQMNVCSIFGVSSLAGPAANVGVKVTGSGAGILMDGGVIGLCATGINVTDNALSTFSAMSFKLNQFDVRQSGASELTMVGCSCVLTNGLSDVDIEVSGAGTKAHIIGCEFNGSSILGVQEGTGIYVFDNAEVNISAGSFTNYGTAIHVGSASDTSSTDMTVTSVIIKDCATDILQEGSSSLNFNSSSASGSKIVLSDPTNVSLAYFDLEENNGLVIGSTADVDTTLLQAEVNSGASPHIDYKPSLYSFQSIGVHSSLPGAMSSYVASQADTDFIAITRDRSSVAGLRLVSDEGSSIGGTTALRGWDINKNSFTAELSFQYQNTDLIGQALIPQFTLMQLDGVNNQMQLPTAATQILFAGDTNLYRNSANVLKTDDNFIVGTLTPGRVVITDSITNQLSSSIITDTEVSYLSGVMSPIQTQLNNKVSRSGDTMTGSLQLPAGTNASPSLTFTGSSTTGLSANVGNLSFSTNALERMQISSGGIVSVNAFTVPGIVHNDSLGNLSSSLIVNADISSTAGIVDTKLATITTAGKVANSATTATSSNIPNTIVSRDASSNFSAGTITASLMGSASNNVLKAGDTMTGVLQLPAGTTAVPSLVFTGSVTTGLSANSNNLSLSTNGLEAMKISPVGVVSINALTSAGIVHNDSSGNLSSSLIVNSDIVNATISNAKLATVSSTNTSGSIVVRDGSGNFSTNMITILGSVTNPTDVATKSYVDSAISTGLVVKTPALVASTTNIILTGLQTIDSVSLSANDRVLLVGQTNSVENGLWVAQVGAWTRPTDFLSGTAAGQAYVLVTAGSTYAGASWVCNTPTAIIDTDPLVFEQFSLPDTTTGANVGTGAGQIFRNKTGITLNFKTIAEGPHLVVTNNADDVTLSTDATNSNTANTIVSRDGAGNFNAGIITADLIGSASGNVLKTGDTMTGTLNIAAQNEMRLQDAAGGEYVGLRASSVVPSSYTLTFPSAAPAPNQMLRAGIITPTNLEWITLASGNLPASSRVIYVTKFGNDSTGNGTFSSPYASLGKAVDVANGLASASDPIAILVSAGVYVEDNSVSPITVTVEGISIIGETATATIIMPSTLSNDLLLINDTVVIQDLALVSGGVSTAAGISFTGGGISKCTDLRISNFQSGVICAGGLTDSYTFDNCFFINNGIGLTVNNTNMECNDCNFLGAPTFLSSPANTGLSLTGSGAIVTINGGACSLCATGIDLNNSANLTATAIIFRLNTYDIIQTAASKMTLSCCTFAYTENPTDIDVQVSGSGSEAHIVSCEFSGKTFLGLPQGTSIKVSDGALVDMGGGGIHSYVTGVQIGEIVDTSSTTMLMSGVAINNCTTDIDQRGSTTLNSNAGSATSSKIIINDPSNVTLAFYDLDDNNALSIGSTANVDTTVLQIEIDPLAHISVDYKSSLYSSQAVGLQNPFNNPTSLFAVSSNNTNMDAITTTRTNSSGIRLFSDTGVPYGGTTALRGWSIDKNASTAELSFSYQNNDLIGQSLIVPYAVMQLDGVNNQVQLPTAATQIVFAGDTNLYRDSANVLKTDDNFIVGTLTSGRVVVTDSITNQLFSSVVTNTELSYLSGVTSSIQTQLNNKVSRSGDTMTGVLQLPAGTTALPSLVFTGSTTTGLSASASDLSLSTSGLERMKISSGGTVSINVFTVPGIVHNDASGNLSSSLIVNADVGPAAAIVDTKLATISTAGKVANSATTATSANTASAIVARDASGNFSVNEITILGTVTNPTDAATKAYVDSAISSPGTNLNTPNTTVKRDSTGSFAAQTISLVDEVISGNISMNDSTSATIGNINKAGTRFVHNFGINNTFVGKGSGNFTMTGTGNNTVLGAGALIALTNGNQNTIIGSGAGTAITGGNSNIIIGYNAGINTTTGNNNIYLDSAGGGSPANENNTIRIGNNQTTTCFIRGIRGTTTGQNNAIAVLVDAQGQLGTISSSARFKHNIQDMADASSDIFDLRPVTFVYNSDDSENIQFGLIAEEVDQVFPALVVYEDDGAPYTVRYEVLPVLLLNEMKKQKLEILDQKEEIQLQRQDINALMQAVSELQNKIQTFIIQ